MGNLNITGLTSSILNIGTLNLELSLAGGIIFALILFFILLIIAGFVVYKLIDNFEDKDRDKNEDRIIGENRGIAQINIDQ